MLFTNSNVYRYREFIPKDAVTELEEVAERGKLKGQVDVASAMGS